MKDGIFLLVTLILVQSLLAKAIYLSAPKVFPESAELDSLFNCDGNKYVPEENICDGIQNCYDGTDERDCEFMLLQNFKERLNKL